MFQDMTDKIQSSRGLVKYCIEISQFSDNLPLKTPSRWSVWPFGLYQVTGVWGILDGKTLQHTVPHTGVVAPTLK